MTILIIIGIAILFTVIFYNSLVSRRNKVDEIFSTIDAMLKKRFDLIPNLVAAAKEYMNYEKETLEKVTALRARAISSDATPDEKIQISDQLTGLIRSIRVAFENYPNLKANENIMHLQRSLNEVEEQIAAARRAYNAAVLDYNNAVDMFPTNIFALAFGFQKRNYFTIPEVERENPNVKNLFRS